MENKNGFTKSIEDEIDLKIIDQLHSATLNFSATSLELKKLLFVIIGVVVPVLIKLAGDKLDISLFITIYLLAVTFWILDSFTYFYQEKLRERMDKHFSQLKARNIEKVVITNKTTEEFTLENKRTSSDRLFRSLINTSVSFYIFVVSLNSVALILFMNKCIG